MATAAHGDTARPVAERLDGAVAARSAHGTIASSLAISFAPRVAKHWGRAPAQAPFYFPIIGNFKILPTFNYLLIIVRLYHETLSE